MSEVKDLIRSVSEKTKPVTVGDVKTRTTLQIFPEDLEKVRQITRYLAFHGKCDLSAAEAVRIMIRQFESIFPDSVSIESKNIENLENQA